MYKILWYANRQVIVRQSCPNTDHEIRSHERGRPADRRVYPIHRQSGVRHPLAHCASANAVSLPKGSILGHPWHSVVSLEHLCKQQRSDMTSSPMIPKRSFSSIARMKKSVHWINLRATTVMAFCTARSLCSYLTLKASYFYNAEAATKDCGRATGRILAARILALVNLWQKLCNDVASRS